MFTLTLSPDSFSTAFLIGNFDRYDDAAEIAAEYESDPGVQVRMTETVWLADGEVITIPYYGE